MTPHLSVTTVAGRHQADVRRARLIGQQSRSQQDAREALERTLRAHGLVVVADWYGTSEPAIAVNCRLESARADREWIYAALDFGRWQPDPKRLTRINARYDVLRLRHRDTAASLMLIISNPCAEPTAWDAA